MSRSIGASGEIRVTGSQVRRCSGAKASCYDPELGPSLVIQGVAAAVARP